MSTPAKSFDDLRSILGKLDRKIDKARNKRLGLDDEPEAAAPGHTNGTAEPSPALHDEQPEPRADETVVGESRRRSPFGRAKPLNRSNPGSENSWIGGAGIG